MKAINAAKLSKLVRDLAEVPSRVARQLSKELNKEVQRGFDLGVDPFGRPWRKLAKSTIAKGRHAPPLTDSKRGRRSVQARPMSGAGIRFTIGMLYMVYHLLGGPKSDVYRYGRPPKRSFLPLGTELPPKWIKTIDRVYSKAMKRVWSG